MIILDTNVISALMLRKPDQIVVSWLDNQPPESMWLTSITVFEIRFGISILKDDAKKQRLQDTFETTLQEDFHGRVLSFDQPAADEAAVVAAGNKRRGHAVDIRDAMISGIARARRAQIATRNVKHFEHTDISIINPWNN